MSVPKLRFPEFDGEWEWKKLSDISRLTSSKRVYLTDYTKNGIPFYRGKEISALKNGKALDDLLYISEEKYTEFKNKFGVPKENDILITGVGTLGNVYRIPNNEPFYFKDGNLIWLKEINENSHFLEYVLDFNKNKILSSAIGSTQKALTIVELNKLKFQIPYFLEQEKIAFFLSKVDEKIEKLEKKQELWETYKKGIMQQIFSQKLRFKDENGEDYPDWEEKKLGDIARFFKGKGVSKNDISRDGIECIRYGELYTTYKEEIKDIVSKTNLTIDGLVLSDKNDIIIPTSGETAIDIATASCVMKSGVAIGGDTTIIKTNENGLFLSYYLNNQRNKIAKMAQGVSVVHLYSNQLKLLKLRIPTINEQNKIADFLSSIEIKIRILDKELKINQEFKRGLLQLMFC